jgi:hypothetical protein
LGYAGMMLDELIDKLSSESASLTEILLKTKVLLVSIDHPELVQWVNAELNGYGSDAQLPEYRMLPASVRGSIRSLAAMSNNHQLPTYHLGEDRKKIETIELRVSISMIQDLLVRDKSDESGIRFPLPIEITPMFQKGLADGWVVNSAWSEVQLSQMADVLTQVRSRLLDFLLLLRTKAGANASTSTIIEKTTGLDISGAFQGAVFGDNVTITLGDQNRVRTLNKKITSEENLYQQLATVGVPRVEIAKLASAINEDKRGGGTPSLTRATGRWYESLLEKAKNGAVSIGADVVSQTVAGLILTFISSSAN